MRDALQEAMELSQKGTMVTLTREEIIWHKDRGYPMVFNMTSHATCSQCGSGEIWQPTQTMDMPMRLSCLNCGTSKPAEEFRTRPYR